MNNYHRGRACFPVEISFHFSTGTQAMLYDIYTARKYSGSKHLFFLTRTPPIPLVNITARGRIAKSFRAFFIKWHAIVMRVQERKRAHAVDRPLWPPPRGRTILPPQTRIESQKSLFLRNFLISSSMTGVFWIIIFLHFCTKLSVLLHPFRSISIILSSISGSSRPVRISSTTSWQRVQACSCPGRRMYVTSSQRLADTQNSSGLRESICAKNSAA